MKFFMLTTYICAVLHYFLPYSSHAKQPHLVFYACQTEIDCDAHQLVKNTKGSASLQKQDYLVYFEVGGHAKIYRTEKEIKNGLEKAPSVIANLPDYMVANIHNYFFARQNPLYSGFAAQTSPRFEISGLPTFDLAAFINTHPPIVGSVGRLINTIQSQVQSISAQNMLKVKFDSQKALLKAIAQETNSDYSAIHYAGPLNKDYQLNLISRENDVAIAIEFDASFNNYEFIAQISAIKLLDNSDEPILSVPVDNMQVKSDSVIDHTFCYDNRESITDMFVSMSLAIESIGGCSLKIVSLDPYSAE